MGKTHPDDLVSSLSKLLKSQNPPTIRLTFKRGGLWQSHFAKAHSRKAKVALKQEIKSSASQEQVYPLSARLRTNEKEDNLRLNCEPKAGRGTTVVESLLGVFRVNFFKKKGEEQEKEKKVATKANPESKSSLKRKEKTVRNQERRKKRLAIAREARKIRREAK